MKKKILTIILATLMITSIFTIPTMAASYPYVFLGNSGMTCYIGDKVPLYFVYYPAYNNEEMEVNIYSPQKTLRASTSFSFSNKYTNYKSFTANWDTSGYEPGLYRIEVVKKFYSLYSWNTAPTNSNSYVTLVKPTAGMSLNNPFKSSKTHFEMNLNTTINTPKAGIQNAVSAWKKLNISNVENPYTIQLTEMYIGDEAQKIALEQNTYNPSDLNGSMWTLLKFNIHNTGTSTIVAKDIIDWINTYLPTGEKSTLIYTCTFDDMPHYNTEIAAGESKEVWFGFYTLSYQGLPFIKLDNSVYMCTNPNCASAHTYKNSTTKATLSKDGFILKKCSSCGWVCSKTEINHPKTISISTSKYTYNGKAKTPSVTVKNSKGKALKKGTDYTVTYAPGRKNVGAYKVTVKMKGNYSGTKALTFKINPPKTAVKSVSGAKKSLKVNVTKKITQVTGYQIQYSTAKSFKSAKITTIKSAKNASATIKSLASKKNYYVRVRTYKTVNKVNYYSDWSATKTAKTK